MRRHQRGIFFFFFQTVRSCSLSRDRWEILYELMFEFKTHLCLQWQNLPKGDTHVGFCHLNEAEIVRFNYGNVGLRVFDNVIVMVADVVHLYSNRPDPKITVSTARRVFAKPPSTTKN